MLLEDYGMAHLGILLYRVGFMGFVAIHKILIPFKSTKNYVNGSYLYLKKLINKIFIFNLVSFIWIFSGRLTLIYL